LDREQEAREALRLVRIDPGRSVTLASAVARDARRRGEHRAAAVAERAWGLAIFDLAEVDPGIRHVRAAITLAVRAGSASLEAEARMSLAFMLNSRGRPRQALEEIERALRQLRGLDRARAQTQRAAIRQILGQFEESLRDYRSALPVLRRAGDLASVQMALANRGIVHAYQHQLAAAEADLLEAQRICEQQQLDLALGVVQQNLGWVQSLRGDVPAALQYFDSAEERYRALRDARLGSLLLDRSELLLSVRLIAEAKATAARAVEAFRRERRQFDLPEARLLLARATLVLGDPSGALLEARRAQLGFSGQQRWSWAVLARFAALTARLEQGPAGPGTLRALEDAAQELESAGWTAASLEARVRAGRVGLDLGRVQRGQRQLEQAARRRRRGPAALRARAWYAEALRRSADGNRRGAVAAIRTGLRILDEYRSTLGATDLRAHVSGHRTELAELGLRIALQEGAPAEVLRWAERGRASHLLRPPVRPPHDPVLAATLTELRVVVSEILAARKSGRSVARLLQRQIHLEHTIRDYSRRQKGDGARLASDSPDLAALSEVLADAALVEFLQVDGSLHAAVLVEGSVRLRALAPASRVLELVDRILFALRRLGHPHTGSASREAAEAMLGHAAGQLDRLLIEPLAGELGTRALVLVPTGLLQSVPWSVLPSCRGRTLSVAPSAALWRQATCRAAPPAGHVVVAAGPELRGATIEAELVAAIHGTSPLLGSAATAGVVAAALNGARLVHLAAHGRVRGDNPLFSSLQLADGPLTVYDLEWLPQAPHTVVLAACDIGQPVVRPGDELLGFSATLLSRDTSVLVAPVVPIPDAETAPLMVAFHRRLAAGHPAATALALTQQELAAEDSTAMAAAAAFLCVGAGS
jgi:tetratricopeptide (TPR) repeat protein